MIKFLRWVFGAGETGRHRRPDTEPAQLPPAPDGPSPDEPPRPAARHPRADETLIDGPPRVSPRIDRPRPGRGPAEAVRAFYRAAENGTP